LKSVKSFNEGDFFGVKINNMRKNRRILIVDDEPYNILAL
jgi:hypothetical protein